MQPTGDTSSNALIIRRGFFGKCPQCGKGKLFKSYLKQVDACDVCSENYATIRADDGPAWLSILLTGHLMLPVAIGLAMSQTIPKGFGLALLGLLTLAMVLIILPRAKGIFIGVLWMLRKERQRAASLP